MYLLVIMVTALLLALLLENKLKLKYMFVRYNYLRLTGDKRYYLERLMKINKRTPKQTYRARIRLMRRYILSHKDNQ